MKLAPVIGLEIHVELGTQSKMFCGCPADHFGKLPNSQVCPVCLGMPGSLPVPNQKAIDWTLLAGMALDCQVPLFSKFDRKHYFYPDLPKGYQISQYDLPFCINGRWKMSAKGGDGSLIRIRRVHLEEDTAKLIHSYQLSVANGQSPATSHHSPVTESYTLIDFNRSGVPLIEIVTEPDIASAAQSRLFVQEIQRLVRWLGVSDADMEKGSMRLEANVSLARRQKIENRRQTLPDYKVELKNINSFRFLEQAINYEIERQRKILEKGGKVIQETRGFAEKTGTTREQRWKEEAKDYRYFPEPDIPPIRWTKDELERIRKKLPELPVPKRKRFKWDYKLPDHYIRVLTETRQLCDYFEEAVRVGKEYGVGALKIADTLINKKPDIGKILPAKLIEILRDEGERPVLSIEQLENFVVQSIEENPKAQKDYRKGKETALQFLIGQVMRKTKGLADPQKTQKILLEKLGKI